METRIRAEKDRIRAEVRRILNSMTPERRAEASRSITRQVLALPEWQAAKTVMAYASLPEEPDTRELMEAALKEGKTLLMPRCLDREHMVALEVKDLDALVPGRLGIPEPLLPEKVPAAPTPDLMLIPCMAASAAGVRLGHGAGYYDRFLEQYGGLKICLCFRALLRPDLPEEVSDVRMDLVISEEGD